MIVEVQDWFYNTDLYELVYVRGHVATFAQTALGSTADIVNLAHRSM